ncbi:MAG TPA: ATP-binding cassette domain-containing protein [Mycobacteriales bacterium]|nr:ATP-binding cassette domain-containing protein [Mycobacteriales bacterium]
MIEASALTKRYGDVMAVDDLTFSIRPGVVTGFLGPNGAGKTTTMKMILGLAAPTAGTVTVGGRRYLDLPAPMRHVGTLLDARAVPASRSATAHLLSLAQSNGIHRRRVGEVLGQVGLEKAARRQVGTFSLGMAQRLGLAAALLGDPEVLMLDEPINGLDPEGIVWIRTFLRKLADEGRTVFVSSHLMAEMALTADHLVIVGRGRLIRDTSVAEFVRTSGLHSVHVRTPDPDRLVPALEAAGAVVAAVPAADSTDDGTALTVTGLQSAAIGRLAASAGAVLYELIGRQPSLEEAFMKLTRHSVEYTATEGGTE